MSQPYDKYDVILNRELTVSERLAGQRARLRLAESYLEQAAIRIVNASDDLTEDELSAICAAVDSAFDAAKNAALLGMTGYNG